MLHPWLKKYPVKHDSKFLILGTHPPMPYCGKLRFFYGNMCMSSKKVDSLVVEGFVV